MGTFPVKPLLIAFACEPGRGSEYGTGWHFIEELSRSMPVYVLAHTLHRQAIEDHLPRHPHHPIHVRYVEMPWLMKTLWGPEMGMNLYYYLWHYKARHALRQWHAQERFSLVHHLTYTRHWMGSVASFLDEGVPFIWGPVGGGRAIPRQFRGTLSFKHRFIENARSLMRDLWRFDPLLRQSVRRANVTLATAPEIVELMRRMGVREPGLMSATALPEGQFEELRTVRPPDRLFRFAFVGRVSHWKGMELAIAALAQVKDLPDVRLRIIGDGPTMNRLRAQVHQAGLDDRVEYAGYFSHAENIRLLSE